MSNIVTRFAPSPTGFLHIGSVRTALFNWLYTKHVGGKFLLRIEDTDKKRSTQEATDAIINGLKWLEINWDGDIVFQSTRRERHVEITKCLVENGGAYYCYMTQDEIAQYKKQNPHKKIISPWRNANASENDKKMFALKDIKPTIRLRTCGLKILKDICENNEINNEENNKKDNKTNIILNDVVQGSVNVNTEELDDMILLRSDGTPTYMMAVVVDDYDMGINYIIRGDDHLTNTFRQIQIYKAMKWPMPQYAHIPLIHGQDGAKLSKRHGALGVEYYRDAGYLPETIRNYLLRLGWGSGEKEIFSTEEAIKLFDVANVNKAPSRFDIMKLDSLNAHYIQNKDEGELFALLLQFILKINGNILNYKNNNSINNIDVIYNRLKSAVNQLKYRSKTLVAMAESAQIYIEKQKTSNDKTSDDKLKEFLLDKNNIVILQNIENKLNTIEENNWNIENIKNICENIAVQYTVKSTLIMQILRANVLGTLSSPPIYEVLYILGKNEVLQRIKLISNSETN